MRGRTFLPNSSMALINASTSPEPGGCNDRSSTPAPISSLQAFGAGLPAAYVQGYGRSGDSYNDPDIAIESFVLESRGGHSLSDAAQGAANGNLESSPA